MKRSLIFSTVLGAAGLLMAPAFAAEADNDAYRRGYGLVLEQSWAEVQTHFEQFQNDFPASEWADDAAFWHCYAIEQSSNLEAAQFTCYENILSNYPDSSWNSDIRSKLLVSGSRLASRGSPQYIQRLQFDDDMDFDFDFDSDNIADAVAHALDQAQIELERVRIRRNDIQLPDLPDLDELVNLDDMRRAMEDVRERVELTQRRVVRRSRHSADDELLSVLAALRNNTQASELLLARLHNSDEPAMRARIVLLLEDFHSEDITEALIEIARSDAAEEVRNNAIIVLIDRNDPAVQDLLLAAATEASYPTAMRAEILGSMSRWDESLAIDTLSTVLGTEVDAGLVEVAADTLADIGSETALSVLFQHFESHPEAQTRRRILAQIADVESPAVLRFLSDIALNAPEDDIATIAIAGIADHENNVAVAALEHIYLNTTSPQRRLAAVHGMGESETLQAVEILEGIANRETDVALLTEVIAALGSTDQPAAVPVVLANYWAHPNDEIRRAAIRALRRLDDFPGATEGLLEILEDRLNTQSVAQ